MQNFFSTEEPQPEVDPAFNIKLPSFTAPPCPERSMEVPHVELRAPEFEQLAARTEPGTAWKDDPYRR